jgi:TolB protein
MTDSTKDYIAFVRQSENKTNLFMIRADGTDERQLTDDKSAKRSPSWSPDGKQLCYSAESQSDGSLTHQIFLLGRGAPRQATHGTIGKDLPGWRPDGKQIAFLAGGVIKVMKPNGDDVRQIYPPPHRGGSEGEEEEEENPGFKSPPITSFIWASNSAFIAALQVMEGENAPTMGQSNWWEKNNRPDGEAGRMTVMEPESLVVLPGLDAKPIMLPGAQANKVGFSWFPDAKRLAVAMSSRTGMHGIVVFRADEPGISPEGLFASIGYTVAPENPAVSPDGKRIAFEVWRMTSAEDRRLLGIAVIPANSGKMMTIRSVADITRIPLVIKGDAREPQWSPDGTRLLYRKYGANARDLWVASADGSNPINLTQGRGDNFDAVWSPAR